MKTPLLGRLSASLARLLRSRSGISTVEFALIAPVFVLLFAGTVDFGLALHKRFQINSAVSAGANYTLLRADDISSANAAALAAQIAAVVAGNSGPGRVTVSVNVNNNSSVTLTDGEATPGEGGGAADACYCPIRNANGLTWGNAVACGAACPTAGQSGKFVEIDVSKPHDPLFGAIVMGDSRSIDLSTFLQAQ